MALTQCRECRKEISTEAQQCPHCGAPNPALSVFKGTGYEWKSRQTIYGIPLVHVAYGRDAQRRVRVAKGIIAIGQFGIGLITIAQFGIGILFGFGQFMLGAIVIAQFAIAGYLGAGQFVAGYAAVGQFVIAYYGIAQAGIAEYLWCPWNPARQDTEALMFFENILNSVRSLFSF